MSDKNDPLTKSDFLLFKAEEIIKQASAQEISLIICGEIELHFLSNYFGLKSPRKWNHKDIDFMCPYRN
jgi:hypothetical protein